VSALDGRVAIITGAGRGLGREHALLMAREGARIVVNDLGGGVDGTGADAGPAQEVVEEIRAMGGEAVANGDDIADTAGAERLVRTAVEAFGRLDVLVNNAGILRDRVLVNMDEAEWDAVIHVHLKGHFAPTRAAAAYWRERSKAGEAVAASVVNTSSGAGLLGNFGQTNYSAAKAGIAAFTITAAMEMSRYGVRVNAIAPLARTRLTLQTPGLGELVAPPEDESAFDIWHPGNVSPLVAYLATEECPFTGGVFHVGGNEVALFQGWTVQDVLSSPDGRRWTVDGLAAEAKRMLDGRPPLASVGTSIEGLSMAFLGRHQSS
jgi:NAD(P)-dependent dehydrogenase (short-subunit alcohol dehydrogenase family)